MIAKFKHPVQGQRLFSRVIAKVLIGSQMTTGISQPCTRPLAQPLQSGLDKDACLASAH